MKPRKAMPCCRAVGLALTGILVVWVRCTSGAPGWSARSPYSFTINDGKDGISTTELILRFPDDVTADYLLISEDDMRGATETNQFSHEFRYVLRSDREGFRSLFVRLLNADGEMSPPMAGGFHLVLHAPLVSFTEPGTDIVTGKRRWYLRGMVSQPGDPMDWVQVRVNGEFVNGHSEGTWWSGYHDLKPGPNPFEVVACNHAGMCVTSRVVITYDPSLASTRIPSFTCDLEDVELVGATTGEISLGGTVDDDNTTVTVTVCPGSDQSVPSFSVTAAQTGTDWWTEIPLVTGTNLVTVDVRTPASAPNRRQYQVIRDPSFYLEITSPRAGTSINAPTFMVTGVASLNFREATIRINGEVAVKTVTSSNVVFQSASPLRTAVDMKSILVTADLPGGAIVNTGAARGKHSNTAEGQRPAGPVIIRGTSIQ